VKHLLLVDDEPRILDSLVRMLRPYREEWKLITATSADEAIAQMAQHPIDAVVSDVYMPGKNGFALLQEVRMSEAWSDTPVIIVTGSQEAGLKRNAIELGATDLLTKPVDQDELVARLHSVLKIKEYQDAIKAHNSILEAKVEERTAELKSSRLEIIWRLAKAGESRDEETGNHVIRVGCYCRIIADKLGLDAPFVELLFLASPLHDIGKIGIPDNVLLKAGKLDDDEWVIMKQHCRLGLEILKQDAKMMNAVRDWGPPSLRDHILREDNPILQMAASIAYTHHEKWDGTGYPQGLKGEDIPIESRIVAVADVYDALRSKRPYKKAFTEEEALGIMSDLVAKHFDPQVFQAFVDSMELVRAASTQFADEPLSEEPLAA
jgi:putative two-component system response regulator